MIRTLAIKKDNLYDLLADEVCNNWKKFCVEMDVKISR